MSTLVRDLAPISLGELARQAALLTRTDRKYVVDVDALADLPALLGDRARVLEIEGRRSFGYGSTYYDTPELDGFHGAARGRRRRFKARTRRYLDTGECWFEVKTRGLRGVTVKERVRLDDDPGDRLPPAAAALLTARLEAARVPGVDPVRLRPTLHGSYRRTTFLVGDARVSVDLDLTWHSATGRMAQAGGVAVIETKSPPGPASPVDHALWARGHRPQRLSKYGTGLVLLHPSLPHHRWHRVLTRQLVPAQEASPC